MGGEIRGFPDDDIEPSPAQRWASREDELEAKYRERRLARDAAG